MSDPILNTRLDIRMLMPVVPPKRPVAPLNYIQWLFNSEGHDNLLIRFLFHNKRISYEEFDGFTYINFNGDPFIRFDIRKDIIYIWKETYGKEISTIREFVEYCEERHVKFLLETPNKCTYGEDAIITPYKR